VWAGCAGLADIDPAGVPSLLGWLKAVSISRRASPSCWPTSATRDLPEPEVQPPEPAAKHGKRQAKRAARAAQVERQRRELQRETEENA